VIKDAFLVLGPLVGVLGIALAVGARRHATRAVAECADLIQGSVGSRGTVDPRALRDLAVVRYDALNEMTGQLSFSIALLNSGGDGVVLSSINGRSETRTYAKVVLGGAGTQPLSPEEEQAVRSARLGTGLPRAHEQADFDPGQAASVRPVSWGAGARAAARR
jgi:hypothetical protein